VADDSALPRYSLSVLSFRSDSLERKADAVRRFMAGWDKAVIVINADREAQRDVLLRHIRVPANVSATYPVPPFPRARVPDREQWQDVMEWMKGRGLLERLPAYEDSVTGAFLPASPGRS
jgi:NitT/TauT family transport system substrate-binding protein